MDNLSQPATLIPNATVIDSSRGGSSNRQLVLSFRQQYLWLYWRSPHDTIYGCFYKGLEVKRSATTGTREEGASQTFCQPGRMRYAVKLVSIQKYQQTSGGLVEDPCNEIRISRHILGRMREPGSIIRNGIIVPIDVLSNRLQCIDEGNKFYFVISQLANNGDLYESVIDNNLTNDMEAIRKLFKQMVKSIHCLHNELNIFHRDLSVENFVLNNDGQGGASRIFVIDFGQAMVIENDLEHITHDGGHFGKPAYTPPELVRGDFTLYWKKVDVWALGITLFFMLYGYPPEWSMSQNELGEISMQQTNIWHPTYDAICKRGLLQRYLEGNNIEYLPVHDLLQNMLRDDPRQRWSTEEILNHSWLSDM